MTREQAKARFELVSNVSYDLVMSFLKGKYYLSSNALQEAKSMRAGLRSLSILKTCKLYLSTSKESRSLGSKSMGSKLPKELASMIIR